MRSLAVLVCIGLTVAVWAADPPPDPSKTSMVGHSVTNPMTSMTATVSGLIVDPAGTYNNDSPPVGFTILTGSMADKLVEVTLEPARMG